MKTGKEINIDDNITNEDKINIALAERSGNVTHEGLMVNFLYELMRDHLATGIIEGLVRNCELGKGKQKYYSNGWLAEYARDVCSRLESD